MLPETGDNKSNDCPFEALVETSLSRRGEPLARLLQAEQGESEEDRDRRCEECRRFCLGVLLGAFLRRT